MNTALDRATNKNDHSHDPQRRRAVADIRSETPAGFGSEQVAGFILECMAGFVGIRTVRDARASGRLPRSYLGVSSAHLAGNPPC